MPGAFVPGSFFVTSITGWAGWGIGVAQALAGAPSRWEHAGVVLTADGHTLEAEPGGARVGQVSDYAGRGVVVSAWVPEHNPFTPDLLAAVGAGLLGTPYSGLDYVALGLLHLHLPSGWVRRRVKASGRLICSQLVDEFYLRCGYHMFDDGRLPGDVMPSDLAKWIDQHTTTA